MEGVFNVKSNEELMDFSECKTAVMFCNGMWCGQSPNNIRNLLKFGYPAHKIKWYRGHADWEILGLTPSRAVEPRHRPTGGGAVRRLSALHAPRRARVAA